MKSGCKQCSSVFIPDQKGEMLFLTHVPQFVLSLEQMMEKTTLHTRTEANTLSVVYQTIDELRLLCSIIEDSFNEHALSTIYCSVKGDDRSVLPSFVPFKEWVLRIKNIDFLTVISTMSFTNHIQPIVDFKTDEVYAYEFVLRPIEGGSDFKPFELFHFAREAGLQSFLDSQARITAIKVGAERLPKGIKRFINFLPSSIYDPKHCLNTTFQAVETYNVDPGDLVFEVVETERIDDISHLKDILGTYQRHGMKVALDDVGAGFSTVEVLKELHPDYVKIDRDLISNMDTSTEKQRKVKEIISIGKELNITILAEGIERQEEWNMCKEMGVQLGQGYFIGKPQEKLLERVKIG